MGGKGSGRKAKPTRLKVLSGTSEHNPNRINKNEPSAPAGWPAEPEGLNAVGLAKWREVCKHLEDMRYLSHVDASLIEAHAVSYQHMIATGQQAVVAGFQDKVANTEYRNWFDRHLRTCSELGLTPSSRTKIVTLGEKDDSEDFFKMG